MIKECDNAEHDWQTFMDHGREIRWCLTCKVPIKQLRGDEAVSKMNEIAKQFKDDSPKIILTPYGLLRTKSLSILNPILDEAWNATIDTIIGNKKFCKELKEITGDNFEKVIHLIGRKKKNV